MVLAGSGRRHWPTLLHVSRRWASLLRALLRSQRGGDGALRFGYSTIVPLSELHFWAVDLPQFDRESHARAIARTGRPVWLERLRPQGPVVYDEAGMPVPQAMPNVLEVRGLDLHAASSGNLPVLRWLLTRDYPHLDLGAVMRIAIESGNRDLAVWCHRNGVAYTTEHVRIAREHGHVGLSRYIHAMIFP